MLLIALLVATFVRAIQAQTTETPLSFDSKHYYSNYPSHSYNPYPSYSGNYPSNSYYPYQSYSGYTSCSDYYTLLRYYETGKLSTWCSYCQTSFYGTFLCGTPTTTSTTPTTTTTTTPATTTALQLCPAPITRRKRRSVKVNNKVLNGVQLSSCSGDGLIGFEQDFTGKLTQTCNGVVATDPTTLQTVIYTTTSCLQTLQFLQTAGATVSSTLYGTTSTTTINALDLTTAQVNGEIAIITPTDPTVFASPSPPCQQAACVYNSATMSTYIDFTTCYVASYGTLTQQDLTIPYANQASIQPGTGCTGMPTGAECFTATTPSQAACTSDTGAPVYCQLTTGEEVLYGLVAFTGTCDTANPTFAVVPV